MLCWYSLEILIFEQGTPHFHFAPGLAVAGPGAWYTCGFHPYPLLNPTHHVEHQCDSKMGENRLIFIRKQSYTL